MTQQQQQPDFDFCDSPPDYTITCKEQGYTATLQNYPGTTIISKSLSELIIIVNTLRKYRP